MSNNIKKFAVAAGVISSLMFGIGAAGAQDNGGGQTGGMRGMGQQQGGMREGRGGLGQGVIREALRIAADETGLPVEDIVNQLRDGSSLADIITANGGDVSAVIVEAVTQATERINEAAAAGNLTQERADALLSNLEQVITDGINGQLTVGGLGGQRPGANVRQNLLEAAATALGIEPTELRSQLEAGTTLSGLITARGGDPAAVVAAAVASATEQINAKVADGTLTQAQADEMISSLETVFTDAINGEAGQGGLNRGFRMGVLRLAVEQTGLSRSELMDALRSGSTLSEILTSNGVQVDAFISEVSARVSERLKQAVETGRLTQERADELLAQLQTELAERINEPLPITVPSV